MNNSWKRFLSLLLAMVMVLSLGVTGFADEGEAEETPAEIAEGSIASAEEEEGENPAEDPAEDALPGDGELEMEEISPDKVHIRKLGLEEEEDLGEIVPMDEEDLNTVVRASIFLDEPATLAAGYSAKGVGTNSAAIGYRDALKARQAEMTAQIESVKTLFTLRKEALMLHIDFLAAGGESASTPAAAKAGAVIRPHTPKTSHR